ncbi:MarR family winged helix-turn-helix transcriptional regulator [Dactylosporangium sp. McL0621]|uniref:MarR family winged helix-turn-helix transcriptional regulator n=1 Tax=Dactylosporangium sp. McL0621 TaxID=3415678 RepID=UPI003CEC1712
MQYDDEDARVLAVIEGAMVAIRRRQTRRALARSSPEADPALFDVVDAVEGGAAGERPVTVTDIASALDVAQPRASKLVANAVEAGLIRREADQRDGRKALLVLTVTGRELCERVHEARRRRFADATRNWSRAERAAFAQLLARFVGGLTETAAERY